MLPVRLPDGQLSNLFEHIYIGEIEGHTGGAALALGSEHHEIHTEKTMDRQCPGMVPSLG